MTSFKVWLKLALALRTPFIFRMDGDYKVLHHAELLSHYTGSLSDREYTPFHDCNAFAWLMKGRAYLKYINTIGFVIGFVLWAKWWIFPALHAWNVCITDKGVFQLEPQNGRIFKRDRRYIPLFVII